MNMQTTMYQDMPRDERERLMASQCLRTEVVDYSRTLSDDDRSAEENNYTRHAMTLDTLEGELKEVSNTYKSKIKAIKAIMAEGLKVIATGKRNVNGKLFLFPDHQSGQMRYFDVYGEMVNKRPLTIDERQFKLFIGDKPEDNKHGEGNTGETVDTHFEEVNEVDPEAFKKVSENQTDAEFKAKKQEFLDDAAKKKKTVKKGKKGKDINDKVSGMIKDRKDAKENFKGEETEAEYNNFILDGKPTDVQPEDIVEGTIVDNNNPGNMENHADMGYSQIPRTETKIDAKDVPPISDDDGLPE